MATKTQTEGIWRANIEARLAALEAEVFPQPPQPLPMLLGAVTDQTEVAFELLESKVGRMGIRRTYEKIIPATFQITTAFADVGKRASWVSLKFDWAKMANGDYDALLEGYATSVPAGHRLMLTPAHEPENDGGVATTYVAAVKRFYAVVKRVRPDILVGPIFIGWTFDSRSGATGTQRQADYCQPLAGSMDFAGLDPYNGYHFPPGGNSDTWDEAPMEAFLSFLEWTDSLSIPGAIGETACAVDTTHGGGVARKVDWINKMVAEADASSCVAFCYFSTNVNHDLDPSALIDAQPESIAAWAAQVAAHTTAQ